MRTHLYHGHVQFEVSHDRSGGLGEAEAAAASFAVVVVVAESEHRGHVVLQTLLTGQKLVLEGVGGAPERQVRLLDGVQVRKAAGIWKTWLLLLLVLLITSFIYKMG